MSYAIETNGIIKTFGTTRALNGVDLRIRQGSVFGLLGPNGAGKTTTIRILATLLRPDAVMTTDALLPTGERTHRVLGAPESVMTTSFIFLMPLTLASNIFVDLSTMPSWLQAVVSRNPVTHLANASRGLMHGKAVGAEVAWVLLASAVLVLVAASIVMRMYRRER